ncbi:MAG: TraB/GumN family protein [Saprospiraceae bacterium]|nr:TraB/GumN family protein [Saprospiraceae bacterium]
MKPLYVTLASFLAAITVFSNPATAQENANHSLLWKVSANGLEVPSYLYGTIHMICEDDYFEPTGLEEAFEATDQLVLEVDISDPSIQVESLKYSFLPAGKTLEDYTTEEEYGRLETFFAEKVDMPLSMLKTMKPFLLSSLMIMPYIDCPQPDSYEMKFATRSKKDGEAIHSLESMEEVMSVLDEIPYERQAQMMVESIDMMESEAFTFEDMIRLYKSQDLEALVDAMSEYEAGSEEFNELLLTKRNNNWMDDLEAYMKDKPSLVAVGAAHLGGETGLIQLLRDKGYTVEPIVQ